MLQLGFAFFKSFQSSEKTVVREPETFTPFNLKALKQWKMESEAIKNGQIIPIKISALKEWSNNNILKTKTLAETAIDHKVANTNTPALEARKIANL